MRAAASSDTLAAAARSTEQPQPQSPSPSPRLMMPSSSSTSLGSMASTPGRERSPSPYIPERNAERDELMAVVSALRTCDADDLTSKLHLGVQIHRLLVQSSKPAQARDDFREAGGFLDLVQILSTLGQSARQAEEQSAGQHVHHVQESTSAHERLKVEIFALALTILHEALAHHPANQRVFQRLIGWAGLGSILRLSGIAVSSPQRFFAALLGFALGDVSGNIGRLSGSNGNSVLENAWQGYLEHPGIIIPLLDLVFEAPSDAGLQHTVLGIVSHLARLNRCNQVAMINTGLSSHLLSMQWPTSKALDTLRTELVEHLYELGIPAHDAREYLRRLDANMDHDVLDMFSRVAEPSMQPNNIAFDARQHGRSAIVLAMLRRPFPSAPSSSGFTFFASIRLDADDAEQTIDVMHLHDAQRTCSVKLSIDAASRTLTYTTRRGAPAAQFAKSALTAGRWHHICLTHMRPRDATTRSRVRLHVDGAFVEEQIVPWPENAPANTPIRAVFGTLPPLESPTAQIDTCWSLGPAYLLDDAINPDLPLVLAELSRAGYDGNFQDSLGRFLTYSTSTRVNLALDILARRTGSEQDDLANHPLVHAITGPARKIFREERFYFVLNAANISTGDRVSSRRGDLLLSAPDEGIRVGQGLLLNQAVTLTRDAVEKAYGYAKLHGNPVLCTSQPLVDTIWKLGGCASLLRLVERAHDSASLERAFGLFLQLVGSSWRLSEDVEMARGYEILNFLLAQKKQFITMRILELMSQAVGLQIADKERWNDAALTNPFLYRIVMLDFSLWAHVDQEVQLAHLDQFDAFLKISKLRRFNSKRVAKMQIARKLLFAIESRRGEADTSARDSLSPTMVTRYISTLRNVFISSFNDAAIRAVSSYLAAQLYMAGKSNKKPRAPAPRRQKTAMAHLDGLSGSPLAVFEHDLSPELGSLHAERSREVAIEVFEMLASLVLERPAFLLKFGSVINIKWLLVFFGPNSDPRAARLSLDIMTTLLAREPRYAERLIRSGGVKVMERLLPRYWAARGIIDLCWASLFGLHLRQIPLEARQSLSARLMESHAGEQQREVARPMMLRLILSCLGEALHSVATHRSFRNARHPRPSEHLELPKAKSPHKHGRQRSKSVNIDARDLADNFKAEQQLEMLRDSISLIELQMQASPRFREVLFTPANLRIFVGAITPYIGDIIESAQHQSGVPLPEYVSVISNRLLDILALAAVEGMTTSGSTQGVEAIIDATPPYVDLATATSFRLAFYDCVARAVKDIVIPGLGDVLDEASCRALADFIEQSSGEVQSSTTLDLISALLTAAAPGRYPAISSSLYTSLDRIILFRLAQKSPSVYHDIVRHESVIFSPANQDPAFFQCLIHNILNGIRRNDLTDTKSASDSDDVRAACYNVVMLMASSRPDMIESVIVPDKSLQDLGQATSIAEAAALMMRHPDGDAPYADEWRGFTKSTDSLKAAIHLDRMSHIKISLDKSDERQRSITLTEARMVNWQNGVRATEVARYAKYRTDQRETVLFAQRQWRGAALPNVKRERAVLGSSSATGLRTFELDPTEGPLRMRAKLKEAKDIDTTRSLTRGLDAPKTSIEAKPSESEEPQSSHGDEWPSLDGAFVDETDHDVGAVSSNGASPHAAEAIDGEGGTEDAADTHDDKYRRVIRSLEKGDVIEGVENSLRVVFIECRASLLIFGKRCFYIVDDYFQRPDGELCNLWEAPEEERDTVVMSTLGTGSSSGSSKYGDSQSAMTLVHQLEGDTQQTRKWKWSDLRLVTLTTFLHRKTAVEISFHDGQTCLLVLATSDQANAVLQGLADRNRAAVQAFETLRNNVRLVGNPSHNAASSNNSGASVRSGRPSAGSGFSRLAGAVLGRSMGTITQRWIDRKISNFDYLMCVNTAAGRTYQDVTQYPIMPFVLRDYTSKELDLHASASFRDLSLPMGAQNEKRRKQFQDRFAQLSELQSIDPEATKPFHYGTHYSTAATVSGYLIRLRPFDKIVKALQGGAFDLPDRIFSSIGQAYLSASEGSLGDVRELIPEAFYLPEFLVNANNFQFGETQGGVVVDDVGLPPWAKGDPRLFIELHRQALESEYVTEHLHEWIDLIFGYKQRGEAAIEAINCFHELSYDDGVDLHSIESSVERQAALKTIHMFGVCPRQLFNVPHPARQPSDALKPTLALTPWLLVQSILPVRTLRSSSVHFIYTPDVSAKPFASPRDYLVLADLGLSISVGHLDNSMRFYVKDNMNAVKSVTEQILPERISCIVDASNYGSGSLGVGNEAEPAVQNAHVLVGGLGGTFVACQVDVSRRDLLLRYACRGHSDAILTLEYSHAWSLTVSGSQDGTAIIWDARGNYVKTLGHEGPVQAVQTCPRNGLIATASGPMLHLWSVNGNAIASVSTSAQDPIASVAFDDDDAPADVDDEGHAVASLGMILTGHRGKVIVWHCRSKREHPFEAKDTARWALEPVYVLEHRDRAEEALMHEEGGSTHPLITAIKVSGDTVVTGDDLGRLYTWNLPGQAPAGDWAAGASSNSSSHAAGGNHCMQCSRKFGVFEKRNNCGACGGLFCATCAVSLAGSPFGPHRFCTPCRDILAMHVGKWAAIASRSAATTHS